MQMKRRLIISLILCLFGGLLVGRSTRAVAETQPAATQPGIQELFRQRDDIADEGYRLAMIGHQPGKATEREALNWLRLRANARRGLRESKAERIAFVEEFVRQLQDQEAFEERLKQQNLVDSDTVLFAHYERLNAQIWLEQEKQN